MQQMNGKNPLHRQERDNLKEELRLLRQKLFGTSSEKRPAPPKEQNLFNEAEKEQYPAAAEAEEMAASLPEKNKKEKSQGCRCRTL